MNIKDNIALIEQLKVVNVFNEQVRAAVVDFVRLREKGIGRKFLYAAKVAGADLDLARSHRWEHYCKYLRIAYLVCGKVEPREAGGKFDRSYWYRFPTPSYEIEFDYDSAYGMHLTAEEDDLVVLATIRKEDSYEDHPSTEILRLSCPELLEEDVTAKSLQKGFISWMEKNFAKELEEVAPTVAALELEEKAAAVIKATLTAEKERAEFLRLKQKFGE